MTGQIETLVIWFLFILQNITCSPVTILLGEKDRQCFYIEVEKDAAYTAKVLLLSGGSVGFSVSNLRENRSSLGSLILTFVFENVIPQTTCQLCLPCRCDFPSLGVSSPGCCKIEYR